uniref:Uncharacterized protein n=1 Tax=Arundo donax TaxID=35708 RepID=A0A0A9CCA2_ARUDO
MEYAAVLPPYLLRRTRTCGGTIIEP